MDILVYNWKDKKNPDRGGAEIIVFELITRLVRDGHRVTLFTRSFSGAHEEEVVDGVHVLRRGNLFTTYWHGYRYYRSLTKKPDIVIDMLNTLFWQTPLYVRGKLFAYVNQLAKEVLFFELPPVVSHLAYFFEKLQFFFYRKRKIPFLCYAESTKRDLMDIGIASNRIFVFPLGINHKQFFPGTQKADVPTFLCINRLVKMKRTDLCIQAMRLVTQQYPDTQLWIMGFGYDKPRLEQLVRRLRLENNVLFKTIPFFSKAEEERTRMMQEAWALLFPSVKEGWGMTVTECAACGTPAIVTDVTGLRDSVRRDETGLVISASPSSEELAQSMIAFIRDESLRKQLSEQAIIWSKNFDWENSYHTFSSHLFRS